MEIVVVNNFSFELYDQLSEALYFFMARRILFMPIPWDSLSDFRVSSLPSRTNGSASEVFSILIIIKLLFTVFIFKIILFVLERQQLSIALLIRFEKIDTISRSLNICIFAHMGFMINSISSLLHSDIFFVSKTLSMGLSVYFT